jgi:hypothetical protein
VRVGVPEEHPIDRVARWLDEWAWSDSLVRLDRGELRRALIEDEAIVGYLPSEKECELFITGGDSGKLPVKLVADFPKTDAILGRYWE